jgi:hypothetical protein
LQPEREIVIGMRGGLFSSAYVRNEFEATLAKTPIVQRTGASLVLFSERNHPGEIDVHLQALRHLAGE